MTNGTNNPNSDAKGIQLRGLWKLFGHRGEEALQGALQGLSKTEISNRFGCVLGVSDVNLDVKPGEIFCIMGLSGSGKSTLLRHVNGLIAPSQGEVIIDGADINKISRADLKQIRASKIGMVFQHIALMPHWSVRDNAAMALQIRGVDNRTRYKKADEVLDVVELTGWGDKFANQLSGGMQQRVGIARALAANPEYLLMDEPFSALDPLIRRQLQDLFLRLCRPSNRTALFITHDLDEAIRIGDRIAIMKDGKIIQIGRPEDIVTKPADDYVADFVSGISKLDLVSAKAIAAPPSPLRSAIDRPPRKIPEDTKLREVIACFETGREQIDVVNSFGEKTGEITVMDLLKGLRS
jgi:glycine betaine/proline transport system ATP-binding protein